MPKPERKPDWLKVSLPKGENYRTLARLTSHHGLPTVCQESGCPNLGECWSSGTATFMLLGEFCTRACRFCSVETKMHPQPPDPAEPEKLVATLAELKLNYLVLTTVDRDDLPDQGAEHIYQCIQAIRKAYPNLLVEILMPDFSGQTTLIEQIANSGAHVFGHNLETVARLTPKVRDPRASYAQSLQVLRHLKAQPQVRYTKTSLLLGLGETKEEILHTMEEIQAAGVDFLTLGQYLQPTPTKLPVVRYLPPAEFQELERIGQKMGFAFVASGPLVRSSYRAFEYFLTQKQP